MVGIIRVIAVSVFVLVAGIAGAQDCATSTAPACAETCPGTAVCRSDDSAGVPVCECVATVDLNVTKMSIKLNFKKAASDSIQLQALVDVPVGFDPTGVKVVVDVGGVIRSFDLDAKGKAKIGNDQAKFLIKKPKNGVPPAAKFAVKFAKGDFVAKLADEGLTNTTVSDLPVTIDVTVDIGDIYLRKLVPQIYTAKQGSTGRTK